MDTKALGKMYNHLTPDERQPLIMAASLRGDEVEADRLRRTAPMVGWRLPDYHGLADGLRNAALAHVIDCLDLAAWMLRLHVQALDLAADPDKAMRDRAQWFVEAERAYGYLL